MIPHEIELEDGYDSVEDIADYAIENAAEQRGCSVDELETVHPSDALSDVVLTDPEDVSPHAWKALREHVDLEIQERLF